MQSGGAGGPGGRFQRRDIMADFQRLRGMNGMNGGGGSAATEQQQHQQQQQQMVVAVAPTGHEAGHRNGHDVCEVFGPGASDHTCLLVRASDHASNGTNTKPSSYTGSCIHVRCLPFWTRRPAGAYKGHVLVARAPPPAPPVGGPRGARAEAVRLSAFFNSLFSLYLNCQTAKFSNLKSIISGSSSLFHVFRFLTLKCIFLNSSFTRFSPLTY